MKPTQSAQKIEENAYQPSEKGFKLEPDQAKTAPASAPALDKVLSVFAVPIDITKIETGSTAPSRPNFNEIDASLACDVEGRVREWYPDRKIEKKGEWLRIGKNGGLKVRASD